MSAMCALVKRGPQAYVDWRKEGLIAGPRGPTGPYGRLCNEQDAIEVALVATLVGRFGSTSARAAWRQQRRSLIVALRRGPRTWIAYDVDRSRAYVFTRDAQLISAVSHGRPVRVAELRREVQAVLDDFRARLVG